MSSALNGGNPGLDLPPTSSPNSYPNIAAQLAADQLAQLQAQQQLALDKQELLQILLALTTGNLGLAMAALNERLSIEGDNINNLSASLNIATDYRQFITETQSLLNGFANPASVGIQDVSQMGLYLTQLQAAVTADPNMDAADKQNILSAISDINNQIKNLPGANGQPIGIGLIPPPNVAGQIVIGDALEKAWAQTSPPSVQLKNIASDFQTLNQSVSSVQSTLQTQVQFQTSLINQYQGIMNDMSNYITQQNAAIVQNTSQAGA